MKPPNIISHVDNRDLIQASTQCAFDLTQRCADRFKFWLLKQCMPVRNFVHHVTVTCASKCCESASRAAVAVSQSTALHFSRSDGPPTFLLPSGRASGQFSVIVQTSGLIEASPYFYILDIHQLVMKKNLQRWWKQHETHATTTVKSGSTVFSVPQQACHQRSWRVLPSNAHNRLKLAAKPQQK